MIRSMKKLLSVSLCASLLTGTAALGTLSANAAEGPMPPFVQTEVFDDGSEEKYQIPGGEISFYALTEDGYYLWNEDNYFPYVYDLYKNGKAYNSETPLEDPEQSGYYYGGIKGAYYDAASNTLFLRNVDQPLMGLDIISMGKNFRLSISGECKLAYIRIEGYYFKDPECSGLTITGNGVLTLDTSGFGLPICPVYAYISDGVYRTVGDVRIKLDKNVSVNLSGNENAPVVCVEGTSCPDSSLVIESANGQQLNVQKKNVTINERLDKEGVYICRSGTYVNEYVASCDYDPDGIYSVYTNYWDESRSEDDDIFYEISKYNYVERFDGLRRDYDLVLPPMSPEEFAQSEFSISMLNTNEVINYYSPDEPESNWHYVGYRVSNSEDTGSDYIYVAGSYIYGKTPAEVISEYNVYKLDVDPTNGSFVRLSDEPVMNLDEDEFERGGYRLIFEDESDKAIEISIPVPEKPDSYYVYYLIENPDDPEGIYGIDTGFYKQYDPNVSVQIKRVKYSDEFGRYIEDPDFVEYIRSDEFENSKYEYVFIDQPICMKAYNTYYVNEVLKDKDGNKYLHYRSFDDYVFTYREDDIVYFRDGTSYYALTPVDVPADDLELSKIVIDDVYDYSIDDIRLSYGSGKAGFANTSYVSTYDAVVGEEVTLHGASVGGKGDKTYALMYRKSGDTTWTKIGTKYGPEDSGSFVPEEEGTYEIMINVKDSTGKVVSATFTVDAVQALTNISTVNTDYIKAGEEVQITGAAKGGTAPYKYEYFYKKSKNAEWTKIKDSNISDGTATFKPSSAVPYDVKVIASDLMGRTDEAVFKLSTSQELKNLSSVSSENVMLGQKVVLHAEASGGTGGYTYALLYKKSSSKTWNRIGEKYGTAAEGSFKPGKAVPYDVMINVKDSSGTVKSKTFKINVTSALKNNSTISADTVKAGEKVVMKGAASGGSGEYKYSFYYKKSRNTAWTAISEYTAKSAAFKPASATSYDVRVVVKDSAGNTAEKNFTVSVTK